MNLTPVMRIDNFEEGLNDMCEFLKSNISDIKTIVEIGSYSGESAVIFAKHFPNAKIYCIDPWTGGFDDADSCSHANYGEVEKQFDIRTSIYKNIIKKKGFSTDFSIKCDIIYIDGCHKYECVIDDIMHWQKNVKKAMCGHDYYDNDDIYELYPHIEGVRRAVKELLGKPDEIFIDGSYVKLIQ